MCGAKEYWNNTKAFHWGFVPCWMPSHRTGISNVQAKVSKTRHDDDLCLVVRWGIQPIKIGYLSVGNNIPCVVKPLEPWQVTPNSFWKIQVCFHSLLKWYLYQFTFIYNNSRQQCTPQQLIHSIKMYDFMFIDTQFSTEIISTLLLNSPSKNRLRGSKPSAFTWKTSLLQYNRTTEWKCIYTVVPATKDRPFCGHRVVSCEGAVWYWGGKLIKSINN